MCGSATQLRQAVAARRPRARCRPRAARAECRAARGARRSRLRWAHSTRTPARCSVAVGEVVAARAARGRAWPRVCAAAAGVPEQRRAASCGRRRGAPSTGPFSVLDARSTCSVRRRTLIVGDSRARPSRTSACRSGVRDRQQRHVADLRREAAQAAERHQLIDRAAGALHVLRDERGERVGATEGEPRVSTKGRCDSDSIREAVYEPGAGVGMGRRVRVAA